MYTTNDLGNIILQWKHLIVTAKQQHIISDLKKNENSILIALIQKFLKYTLMT